MGTLARKAGECELVQFSAAPFQDKVPMCMTEGVAV